MDSLEGLSPLDSRVLGLPRCSKLLKFFRLFRNLSGQGFFMARQCDLTGKSRQANHKVSHSNIKTRTFKQPNLKTKKIFDPESGQTIRLKLATSTIKTLDKMGLSKFLRKYYK
jgi:large subunit ribosomal protein L28